MRPYLAIIRDSFHEALASRVLWILLAIVTLFLVALLPLGINEQAGSVLRDDDFLNRERFVEKIVAAGKSDAASPGHRIWELFDEPTRRSMVRQGEDRGENRLRFFGVVAALQKVIARPDFYQAEDWEGIRLPSAAQALELKGLAELPPDQLARFNRLALEAAFPDDITPAPPKQFQVTYLSWELGLPLPVEKEQLHPLINQIVVGALSILLGVAGVFVAVLVTASMIPLAFEAGSVDLLLSKPISRGWLFLAKFVGGCAFIAINAAYLIGGLWLILGIRFGLWNERLLWAIPLYLFLFAIYYGVSALAGIVWRNAIVSVVLAILFWFVCFVVGQANQIVEALSLNPRRLVALVSAGDTLIAANTQGELFRWDEGDWRKIFMARDERSLPQWLAGRLAGPVYDPVGQRIFTFRTGIPAFSPLQSANKLLVGKRASDWQRSEGVKVPDGAFTLFVGPRDDLLVVSSQGIYRLDGESETKQSDINFFGLRMPLPQRGGQFTLVGPKTQLRQLESAAIDATTGAITLFDGHRLLLFVRDEPNAYVQAADLSFDSKQAGKVALGGGKLFLALADGEIRTFDYDLKPGDPIRAEISSVPQRALVSPDGRFLAIAYSNLRLWLFDVERNAKCTLALTGQGDISAAAFTGQTLLVADRLTRVTRYDLEKRARTEQMQGEIPLAETIYRYALHPLYTIFPKPGELNQTVMSVLSKSDTIASSFDDNDRNVPPTKLDVWGPVWSNLAFLVVVLTTACVYVARKDF